MCFRIKTFLSQTQGVYECRMFFANPDWIGLVSSLKKWNSFDTLDSKVHIFWEGHKVLRNLHLTFDYSTYSKVKISQNFVAFSEYMNINTFNHFCSNTSVTVTPDLLESLSNSTSVVSNLNLLIFSQVFIIQYFLKTGSWKQILLQ